MKPERRLVLILLLGLWIFGPSNGIAQVRLENPERNLVMNIGGWIQPRYEYTVRDGAEDLSSFYLRRVRLDVRGHVFSPEFTYRILPEMARTVVLRDAWFNYAFTPSVQLRIGQFTMPFQWHRYVSPRRQHFAERGLPSETFGFPDARDIGLMLHGVNPAATVAWGLGVFDGAGRNVQYSNSSGNLASARVTIAVMGTVPTEETDYRRLADPRLSLGAGIQAATKNEVRAWDLGRSPTESVRADWVTATADLSFRMHGFSVAADGYLRQVDPDDVESYSGWGFMTTAGIAVVPERLEIVGRYSLLRLDQDDPATEQSQWGTGINIYHRGHDLKTRVQYLHHTFAEGSGDFGSLIVEFHIQF